ncbi:hypothetical protein Drorol1_Dr00005613 [Drosera rotundifolia]
MTKASSSINTLLVDASGAAGPKTSMLKFAQLLRLSQEPNNHVQTNEHYDDGRESLSSPLSSNPPVVTSPPYSSEVRPGNGTTTTTDHTCSGGGSGGEGPPSPTTPATSPNIHHGLICSSSSPYVKSPWIKISPPQLRPHDLTQQNNVQLLETLLREDGHVYSLAASGDMLFTGSDARNIRVWKNFDDFGGFKSNSGFVKAIVVAASGKIVFTGHQDGKIRVWKVSDNDNPDGHKRIGTLPTLKDYVKSSILNPKSYYLRVRRRRKRVVPRVKHLDAVSCLNVNNEAGLLYSGSWDKTIKVWRISDSKCLETIEAAHEDAINSIVVGFGGLVFSGSADGTVKVWKRDGTGRHVKVRTLLSQENAVNALAVNTESEVLYSGTSDGLVNFWEGKKKVLSYGGVVRGHKVAVLCLATAGNGLLFSGSADNTVCVWKRQRHSIGGNGIHVCLAVLTGHAGPVKCLAVNVHRTGQVEGGDGEGVSWILYSGSLDKSIRVWRVSIQDQQPNRYE